MSRILWWIAGGSLALTALGACGSDNNANSSSSQTSSSSVGGGGQAGSSSVTDSSATSGSGGGGGMQDPCDEGFGFIPTPLQSGFTNTVTFTHADPLVYVDLAATGPGEAYIQFESVNDSTPYTWQWSVTLPTGSWAFTFAAGQPTAQLASCSHQVSDTGPPPDPPINCNGKSCGDPDGDGGLCQGPCKLVGSQLANPSPCGPSEQDSPWQTLDNAGCLSAGTLCKIWCPYEKCSGCPNGTEAVFVPSTETSYEAACKAGCEAFGACWDSALSLCRNPGDCGTPLGQCPWQ